MIFRRIFLSIVALCFFQTAQAFTVNINAANNGPTNPILFNLTAGEYLVTPIGIADGGLYDALSNFSSGDSWAHYYTVNANGTDMDINTPVTIFATPALALQNAVSTIFTLNSDGPVTFRINDSFHADNRGGVSLSVQTVPIPPAAWLFGSALGVMGWMRRRMTT